jgi:hypothetical protein
VSLLKVFTYLPIEILTGTYTTVVPSLNYALVSECGQIPVAHAGELLLLRQQLPAGGDPLLWRHHLGQVHACAHLGSSQSDAVAPGGPASTLGTYSSSCSRPSKVRLLSISRATSG